MKETASIFDTVPFIFLLFNLLSRSEKAVYTYLFIILTVDFVPSA